MTESATMKPPFISVGSGVHFRGSSLVKEVTINRLVREKSPTLLVLSGVPYTPHQRRSVFFMWLLMGFIKSSLVHV